MFNFSEPQGRLEMRITCYLKKDLTNNELERVFNEFDLSIKHKLISEFDFSGIDENGNYV